MKMTKPFRIDMQFFAEGGATSSTEGATSSQNDSTANNATNNTSGTEGQKNASQNTANNEPTSASLEKLIQSAVDRATNKLGNENKDLKKQIDELVKKSMTDAERVELERKQEREQFEQEKAQFIAEKNRLHAVTALAKADLNIASDKLDTLVGLVMGADEKAIDENVKNLNEVIKTIVADKVAQTFKDNGRNPVGSGNADAKKDDKNDIGSTLGKATAAANAKSNDVLKHYLGG